MITRRILLESPCFGCFKCLKIPAFLQDLCFLLNSHFCWCMSLGYCLKTPFCRFRIQNPQDFAVQDPPKFAAWTPSNQISPLEKCDLNPCCLMIRSGIILPFIHWGLFYNPRTGNPELSPPVFHGMIEGFLNKFQTKFHYVSPLGPAWGKAMCRESSVASKCTSKTSLRVLRTEKTARWLEMVCS